jgi:2-oxoglutarate dehydrogenase complex dihydrolipoamide succinyltransferase (E2) component
MEFKLPDIGEGVAEGEVVRWIVTAGETVVEDQPMVEVMTDKATVEIPAPADGTIAEIRVPEGETVPVGSVLVVLDTGDGAPTPAPAAAPAEEKEAAPAAAPAAPAPTAPRSGKVRAAPATRKLAREMGIDIQGVAGTGPNGRVTKDDVRRHAEGEAAPAAAPAAAEAPAFVRRAPGAREEERVPLRGMRKRIAEAMHVSKSTAAHYTYVEEVDVTKLVALRKESKALAEERGVKLTYLAYIAKALVPALRKFPLLNATLDEATQEIVLKRYYNLGIAVDTPAGLIVPVVKDVDQRTLLECAAEIERVAGAARDGKSALEDLKEGTFTITSAGSIGGLLATPVINYPEVAILGVHKIVRRPVVVEDDRIEPRDIMYLSLSLDHRIVDGAVGAYFMNEVVRRLENPGLLLMDMA